MLERELAVDVDRIDRLVSHLLGQAEADLLDLVARQLVLAGEIFVVALGVAVVSEPKRRAANTNRDRMVGLLFRT